MNRYNKIPIRILQTVLISFARKTPFAQRVVHYELYVKIHLSTMRIVSKKGNCRKRQIPMPTSLPFYRGRHCRNSGAQPIERKHIIALVWCVPANKETVYPGLHKTHRRRAQPTPTVSDYPAWYAPVSFPFYFAGADWDVRSFINEEKMMMIKHLEKELTICRPFQLY